MNSYNTCRLCKDTSPARPLLKYSVRHYCHAECGFFRWGTNFLYMIPAHEIGNIPYGMFRGVPDRINLAKELCPDIAAVLDAVCSLPEERT